MLRHYHKTWKDNQMIQLAEEAMKVGYNRLLTDLAKPTSTTRAQTMGLPADDFDECILDDNSSAVDGVAQPPVLTTFPAPSAVAPQRVSYVASQEAGAAKPSRRCFYFPFCVEFAHDCGGWRDCSCSRVNTNKIGRPSQEQLNSTKEEKRLREQERRKKRRKTSST
jgi:hypothetical protein